MMVPFGFYAKYWIVCDLCRAKEDLDEYQILPSQMMPFPRMPDGWTTVSRNWRIQLICPNHEIKVKESVESELDA